MINEILEGVGWLALIFIAFMYAWFGLSALVRWTRRNLDNRTD